MFKNTRVKYSLLLILMAVVTLFALQLTQSEAAQEFYVDVSKGNDANSGSIDAPFQSIEKALQTVGHRVDKGIYSDKIFLRAGVYKSTKSFTPYLLNLKGTKDNYSILSAMPTEPNAPNAVKHKSGKWYEKVVIDDAQIIASEWTKLKNSAKIWVTDPGYTHIEWIHSNLWPWRWKKETIQITDKDDTPETTAFTVAPYMLLQDDSITIWAESVEDITAPGMRYYNNETKKLYLWPLDDKDPNLCKIETWYGGPQDYDSGMLHLDGEGRAFFKGSMEYASIRGFEFRMFQKLFEFHRRGYKKESEREIQRYVHFEDNICRYGWIHILLDANTIHENDTLDFIRPRYEDRSNWLVRNNVFEKPSREVCQLHGDDHIFEHNEIIDHTGPWAGPAACVSVVNTRNTRNMKIRHNYIRGNGNSQWNQGSIFMIEVHGDPHTDENGDYIFGGQTYEYNIIADISRGPIMFLGKGYTRMKDITIRNNIFVNSREDAAILISSPQKNLKIENNVFYNLAQPIEIKGDEPLMRKPSLPSSISISNNIFMNNEGLIDKDLFVNPAKSKIMVDKNIFFNNKEKAIGTNFIEKDPLFFNPQKFDFRCENSSPSKIAGHDLGAYDEANPQSMAMKWWLTKDNAPDILEPYSATLINDKNETRVSNK